MAVVWSFSVASKTETSVTLSYSVSGIPSANNPWDLFISGPGSYTSYFTGNTSGSGNIVVTGLSPNTSYSWSANLADQATSYGTKSASTTTNGPTYYTVTWNANGGSVSPTSNTVTAGSSVTAPTPTRSNYGFNGWYTAASGGSFVVGAGGSYTPSGNITLYAAWSSLPTASVTINSTTSTTASVSWNNNSSGGTVGVNGIQLPAGATWSGTGTPDSANFVSGSSGSGTISNLSAATSYTVTAIISTLGWVGYPDGERTFTDSKTIYTNVTPPVFSDSTLSSEIYKDLPYSDAVAASPVTSYSWSGNPAGLSINSSTGAISGTPTTEATYTITITATNAASGSYGASSTSFSTTLTVKPATPKVYTGPTNGWQRSLGVWTYTVSGWQRAQIKVQNNSQWNPPL